MKTIPLTVRIDATVKNNLDTRARLKNVSTADVVREILISEDAGHIISRQISDSEKLKKNLADIDEKKQEILSAMDKSADKYNQRLADEIHKISESLNKLHGEIQRRSEENINHFAATEKTAREITGLFRREGWTEVCRWMISGLAAGLLVGVAVFFTGLLTAGDIADRSAAAVRAELRQAPEQPTTTTAPPKRTGRER